MRAKRCVLFSVTLLLYFVTFTLTESVCPVRSHRFSFLLYPCSAFTSFSSVTLSVNISYNSYADDTQLLISLDHDNLTPINSPISYIMTLITGWLEAFSQLNRVKTEILGTFDSGMFSTGRLQILSINFGLINIITNNSTQKLNPTC